MKHARTTASRTAAPQRPQTAASTSPAAALKPPRYDIDLADLGIQALLTISPVHDPHKREADQAAPVRSFAADQAWRRGESDERRTSVPGFSFSTVSILPKMALGQPGDALEVEADRVAEQVMRMPEPGVARVIQRKRSAYEVQRKCAACEDKEKTGTVQAKAASVGQGLEKPARSVETALAAPSAPLDRDVRGDMEARFGADFGAVRIHADSQAADSARAINARAYTVGRDIMFGFGEYSPRTQAGRFLLAHELTHVIQQGQAPSLPTADPRPTRATAAAVAPRIQRACGPAIGAPADCTAVEGDLVGEHFLFVVNCDDFQAGHEARLRSFAATLTSGGTVQIHGFASIEGDAAFNERLACARGLKAQEVINNVLVARGVSLRSELFQHGATAGDRTDRRSVTIDWLPATPTPTPTPTPTGCITPPNPDMSGRAFNPTTDSQNAVIAAHPIDALTVNGLADEALAAARASGLPGLHLGRADAFRHCFWSCRMTQELGAARAEQFGTAHENSGPSAIPFDNQMDLHDNAVGRSLGTPGDCDAQCRAALAAGNLRTIRGTDADGAAAAEGLSPASPPVTPACIGASSQPWP